MSNSKQNPPALNKKPNFKGFRKPWRVGEPPIEAHGVCRRAMNQAIRNEHFGIADAIAAKRMRRVYASVSKPELLRGLNNMLRFCGMTPKTFDTRS